MVCCTRPVCMQDQPEELIQVCLDRPEVPNEAGWQPLFGLWKGIVGVAEVSDNKLEVWHGVAWHGMAWCGVTWCCVVLHHVAWCVMAMCAMLCCAQSYMQ